MTEMIPAWCDDTLTPVEKLEAHKQGLKHKAVSVFLFHGDKVLIQQRAAEKYHTPNLWANTCCTHPHWGEDPALCAQRRLEEELGITGFMPKWVENLEYRADVGGGLVEHEVVDLFVIHCDAQPDPEPSRGSGGAMADPRIARAADRAHARGLHPVAQDLHVRTRTLSFWSSLTDHPREDALIGFPA